MEHKDLHDSSIYKIMFDKEKRKLILGLETENKERIKVSFLDVEWWDFTSFQMQNVLFDFKFYSSSDIPEYIFDEYDVHVNYIDKIREGIFNIAIIDPSIGLGGYIICKSLIME